MVESGDEILSLLQVCFGFEIADMCWSGPEAIPFCTRSFLSDELLWHEFDPRNTTASLPFLPGLFRRLKPVEIDTGKHLGFIFLSEKTLGAH